MLNSRKICNMSGKIQDRLFLLLLRKLTFKTFANRSLFFLGRGVGIPRTKKKPTQKHGRKVWSWENRGENINLPRGSDNFFDRKAHFTSQSFFSYSNPANTFHSKFIWGQRKRVLNADTCNGNVSSIHQDCWSWQQSSAPWSVQSLKYSCLTMGLSKRKYLLLLLSPPHASNLYPQAQKPRCWRPKHVSFACVVGAELP